MIDFERIEVTLLARTARTAPLLEEQSALGGVRSILPLSSAFSYAAGAATTSLSGVYGRLLGRQGLLRFLFFWGSL